ncbi:YihY/virulence factor BrkB family protein [Prochlorothrix hollandica]|uniref:YihY/virulence factor BrkB family protein n=1 Tax=Prochlorothrix hollandica TaxID=1223 RepID=UPI000346EF55|nr:YihY/virulence factor BrkB family protein [Prochlorothrix hollandica]
MFNALRYINWSTCVGVTRSVVKQRLPGLAAEIAYNATLSLFPTILSLLAAISTLDLSRPALKSLATRFAAMAPLEVVDLIRSFVDLDRPPGRLFQISFLVALWVSSSALASTMAALDQIQQTPRSQRRPFWKTRSIAVLLTLGTMALYIISAFLIFIGDFVIRLLAHHAGGVKTVLLGLWWMLNWPISLGLITLAFACLYRFGPSQWDRRRPIFLGAFLAALAWLALSFGFRHYLRDFDGYTQVYGALATAVILMIWLNLCALVMLIGYQLNVTVGDKMARSRSPLAPETPSYPPPNPGDRTPTIDPGLSPSRDPAHYPDT